MDGQLPKHALAKLSDPKCVIAMTFSILSGRQALGKQDEWLGKIDAELPLGEGIDTTAFHDTRLGVALDRLDGVATDRILGVVVTRYLTARPVDREGFSMHLDTRSVSLFGAHEGVPGPTPLHGYSKDKRPELNERGSPRLRVARVERSAGGRLPAPGWGSLVADESAQKPDHLAMISFITSLVPPPMGSKRTSR